MLGSYPYVMSGDWVEFRFVSQVLKALLHLALTNLSTLSSHHFPTDVPPGQPLPFDVSKSFHLSFSPLGVSSAPGLPSNSYLFFKTQFKYHLPGQTFDSFSPPPDRFNHSLLSATFVLGHYFLVILSHCIHKELT